MIINYWKYETMLKEYIQRLKDKFNCLKDNFLNKFKYFYLKIKSFLGSCLGLTLKEDKTEWGWDANGSPISEEGEKFNKDYDAAVERVQKQLHEEDVAEKK